MVKPKRKKRPDSKLICEGVDLNVLKKLNNIPCQPPSRCSQCDEQLNFWINRASQEKKMGWEESGVKFIFNCPKCGKYSIERT